MVIIYPLMALLSQQSLLQCAWPPNILWINVQEMLGWSRIQWITILSHFCKVGSNHGSTGFLSWSCWSRAVIDRQKEEGYKWIKSITDLATTDCEDFHSETTLSDSNSSDEAPSDGASATGMSYKFPYDILNVNELKAILLRCVGSAAVTTDNVPGPISNPTKADERREVLGWLDEHPELLETHGSSTNQTGEDTSLRDANYLVLCQGHWYGH